MEALHGGSSSISFFLQLFFKFSLEVMIRQAILKNKHGAQHMFFFWGVQVFFILHSEVQFFLPYLLWWCYVTLHNFLHGSWFILLSRMRYFKSINLFVGVILCHISPKAFPKECCYLWCLSLIQAFSISFSMKEVFISSLLSNKQLCFVSGRISLQALRCFP